MISGPAASASYGNLLEMHILGPNTRFIATETLGWSPALCLTINHLWVILIHKFENHCSLIWRMLGIKHVFNTSLSSSAFLLTYWHSFCKFQCGCVHELTRKCQLKVLGKLELTLHFKMVLSSSLTKIRGRSYLLNDTRDINRVWVMKTMSQMPKDALDHKTREKMLKDERC